MRLSTALLLLGLLAAPALAGVDDLEEVRAFVRTVQDVRGADARAVAKNILRVEEALASREAKEDAGAALLLFTLGWLHEQHAARSPESAAEDLRRASGRYARFLGLRPGHPEGARAHARVVLAAGGDGDTALTKRAAEAARILEEQAFVAGPAARGELLLEAGELRFDGGDWRAGLQTVARARDQNASAGSLTTALIRMYGRLPRRALSPEALGWLTDWCDRFATGGTPEGALPGLRLVARTDAGREAMPHRVRALVLWTSWSAELGTLNAASVATLPSEGLPGVASLRKLFSDEPSPEGADRMWQADDESARAYVAALRARARIADSAGNGALAEKMLRDAWLAARERGDKNGHLGALLDMATLLNVRREEIDADERKFREVEGELFDEKMKAYQQGDAATIERTHTIFAQIYVERGRVVEGGLRAAPYHVQRARMVARDRLGRGEDYEPYPELSELLAGGLEAQGMHDEALARHLDATMGYLELDDLGAARRNLDSARDLSADGVEDSDAHTKIDALEDVLGLRRAGEAGRAPEGSLLKQSLDEPPAALPREFAQRQWLRAVGDLGRKEELPEEVRARADALLESGELELTARDAARLSGRKPPRVKAPEALVDNKELEDLRKLRPPRR